jgi:hypothetical protein
MANMGSGMVKKNGRSLCFDKNMNKKWFTSRLFYEMSALKVNDGNLSKENSKYFPINLEAHCRLHRGLLKSFSQYSH